MASGPKKVKDEPSEWFTTRKFESDVTLKFDDRQELYVAKDFLKYSSPVFEAMFTHEMKEKQEGTVELKGKAYTDFLTLLLVLHPRVTQPIDESTVLSLLALSLEYQISALVANCKTKITQWMREASHYSFDKSVNTFLKIIKTACMCNQDDIVAEACQHLSKFKFELVEGRPEILFKAQSEMEKENEIMFKSLDSAVISSIYRCRLQAIDNL